VQRRTRLGIGGRDIRQHSSSALIAAIMLRRINPKSLGMSSVSYFHLWPVYVVGQHNILRVVA